MSTRLRASAGSASSAPAADGLPPGATLVAALQMASGPHVEANLREAARLLEIAASQGARLAALPEYFPIMGMHEQDKVRVREADGSGPVQDFLSASARKHGMWIVGGSIPLEASVPDKVRNTTLVYDDTGKRVARYDKIHLFGFELGAESYSEPRTIEPGSEVVVVETPFARIGLSICYDLRFPELYRAMKEVDLILVPSAFTETTGKVHWEVLLRARAIENLAYVLAPAQGGYHVNGRETHGDSMLVDPWGVIVDRLPRGSGIVIGAVDPQRIARLRASLPALAHRTF